MWASASQGQAAGAPSRRRFRAAEGARETRTPVGSKVGHQDFAVGVGGLHESCTAG